MNKVLDLEEGNCFGQKTKGLKIWSTACVKDNEDLSIFFVDCESGTGDKHFEQFVWSLAFLIGSVVMMHSVGPLDQNFWLNFEALDALKKKIVFSEDEIENEFSLSHSAPRLIWLMRDYEITLKDTNGRVMTSDNYLDMELRDNDGSQTINERKLSLINIFKERLAFAMPTPSENPVGFHQGTENLNEEFLYHLEHLRERIYSKTGPKLFEGVAFDSRMFLNAVNCLIEVFNSGKPLFFNEMVEIVFQEEVDMLLSDGKEFYNDLFLKAFPDFEEMEPVPIFKLLEQLKFIRQNTFENFTLPPQIKMKMSDEFTECFESLQRYIENSERIFLKKNEEKAVEVDHAIADDCMKWFDDQVDSHPPEGPKKQVEVFSQLIEKVCADFVSQAISEQKSAVLARLISSMNAKAFERIMIRQKSLSPEEMGQENEFREKNQTIDQKIEDIEKNNKKFGDDIQKKREEIKDAHETMTETLKEKQALFKKLETEKKNLNDLTEAVKQQEPMIVEKKAELEKLNKKKKKRFFCF